jgi:hypothetical protein
MQLLVGSRNIGRRGSEGDLAQSRTNVSLPQGGAPVISGAG